MAIVKVWITDDCTACNLCVDTCPEVFELPDDKAEVIEGADFNAFEDEIIEASEACPVEAIKFTERDGDEEEDDPEDDEAWGDDEAFDDEEFDDEEFDDEGFEEEEYDDEDYDDYDDR